MTITVGSRFVNVHHVRGKQQDAAESYPLRGVKLLFFITGSQMLF